MSMVTQLDPDFVGHLDKMEEVSTAAHKATLLTGQRMWMMPPLGGWDGDTLNIKEMAKAFDRARLNKQYVKLITDRHRKGKIGEVMITKLQVDYLSQLERAFRTRHASSVRLRLHAAVRRQGQGKKQGPFGGGVALWLQRILSAAHDTPTP